MIRSGDDHSFGGRRFPLAGDHNAYKAVKGVCGHARESKEVYDVTRKAPQVHIALIAALAALVLVPSAIAGKPGGGHGGGSCTRNTPGVVVDNNYAWGQHGSFGLAGQALTYAIDVINYDAGCSSSTFTISISAPAGFSVSLPTNTISLRAGASGYVWATVTSPAAIANGDYPLTVTAVRAGTSNTTASFTSYYKVYSSDSVAPSVFWPNPGNGSTITAGTYAFTATSSDDHSVRKIELYIDNVYASTTLCNGVAYTCSLYDSRSISSGAHTATFESYDWMGNVGAQTVSFTVS